MLDKIPAIMIDPAVVIDTRCDPAGLKVVFSDGTSKVLTCVGGGGGGRPNMAQAGGKNPDGMKEALEKAVEVVKKQLM